MHGSLLSLLSGDCMVQKKRSLSCLSNLFVYVQAALSFYFYFFGKNCIVIFTLFFNFSGLPCTEIEIEKARSMSPGRFSGRQTRPDCFLKLVMSDSYDIASNLQFQPFAFKLWLVLSSNIYYNFV